MKEISISFIKILVSSIIMGVLAKYLYDKLIINMDYKITLFLSMMAGGAVYLLLVSLMRIKDVEVIIKEIKTSFKCWPSNNFTSKVVLLL